MVFWWIKKQSNTGSTTDYIPYMVIVLSNASDELFITGIGPSTPNITGGNLFFNLTLNS